MTRRRYGTTVVMRRFTRWVRIPPDSLPADFFVPPTTQKSLWDRVLGWVRDRMAGR